MESLQNYIENHSDDWDWDAAPLCEDQKQNPELIQKNISKANDCDRGLAAYLFTTDYAQVLLLIQGIQNYSWICSNSNLKISITVCTVDSKYANILYLFRPGEFQAH